MFLVAESMMLAMCRNPHDRWALACQCPAKREHPADRADTSRSRNVSAFRWKPRQIPRLPVTQTRHHEQPQAVPAEIKMVRRARSDATDPSQITAGHSRPWFHRFFGSMRGVAGCFSVISATSDCQAIPFQDSFDRFRGKESGKLLETHWFR